MKGVFLGPFVQESRTMTHLTLTRAFLQLAATATMHCHPPAFPRPTPTASAEPIFKTDCINLRITCGRISMTTIVVIGSSKVEVNQGNKISLELWDSQPCRWAIIFMEQLNHSSCQLFPFFYMV